MHREDSLISGNNNHSKDIEDNQSFSLNPNNTFNQKQSIENILEELPYSFYYQLHNKYILVQTQSGIIFVDQHNAHERVIFESAIERLNNLYSKGQATLFPIEIVMKVSYISILQEIEEEIKKLGFEFEIKQPETVIITAKPYDVPNGIEERMLVDILDDYLNSMKLSHSSKREKIAATFSCKSAIKTGEKLSTERMKQLTIDLFNCKIPYVCPHGRPIILELSLNDLDKQFGRI
jgi:DNA mismatch repair protein MutL